MLNRLWCCVIYEKHKEGKCFKSEKCATIVQRFGVYKCTFTNFGKMKILTSFLTLPK